MSTQAAAIIEAEQCLIGAALLNNDAIAAVDGIVTADDFSEPVHGFLWRTMQQATTAGRRVDPKLLVAAMGTFAGANLGTMTASQYVARLASEATTVINAPDYARVVKDAADRIRLSTVGAALQRDDLEVDDAAVEAIDAIDAMLSARSTAGRTNAVGMNEAAAGAMDASATAFQADGKITGLSWGLSALDRRTLGMHAGELIIMAGRPGMGKSALALSVARRAAAQTGVLFVSLEMGGVSMAHRVMSDYLYDIQPIPYWAMRAGRFNETEFVAMRDAAQAIGKLNLTIEQQASLSAAQIVARARQLSRRKKIGLVIVDHLHLVRASERYRGNRVEEIGETTRAFKAMSREIDAPVLALCQLSRAVEGREDKRPNMSDLRGSGDIEQDADMVMMLYRESYYLERRKPDKDDGDATAKWFARMEKVKNRLDILIEKQRNGPVGTVPAFCSISHNAVRDLAQADQQPEEEY